MFCLDLLQAIIDVKFEIQFNLENEFTSLRQKDKNFQKCWLKESVEEMPQKKGEKVTFWLGRHNIWNFLSDEKTHNMVFPKRNLCLKRWK